LPKLLADSPIDLTNHEFMKKSKVTFVKAELPKVEKQKLQLGINQDLNSVHDVTPPGTIAISSAKERLNEKKEQETLCSEHFL
jgi:hypothetical protein